jgi:hypothetical protein
MHRYQVAKYVIFDSEIVIWITSPENDILRV